MAKKKAAPSAEGLVGFMPFQRVVFWAKLRMIFLLWARQTGKSHTFACKALSRCIQHAGHSVFYVSGSINMGAEIILKEAAVWQKVIDAYRQLAAQAGTEMNTSADDDDGKLLDIDAIADLFQNSKLECTIKHPGGKISRTKVLSPNPQTARGFSGDVLWDEIGFMPDYKATFDAATPIVRRVPWWIIWGATSPPADDKHPTFELLLPGDGTFDVNPEGNWLKTAADESDMGFPLHRVDAYDAEKAGLPMYSLMDGKIISIGEARREYPDKDAFDRNFLLKFIPGGTAALDLQDIMLAQMRGANLGVGNKVTEQIKLAA